MYLYIKDESFNGVEYYTNLSENYCDLKYIYSTLTILKHFIIEYD